MKTLTVFVIVTIVGTTRSRIVTTEDYDADVNYNFKYGVENEETGDFKSHQEVRNGKEVSGVYTVREPDGTTRIVKYTAGPEKGFNAVVEYVGTPHDEGQPSSGFNYHEFQTGASEPVVLSPEENTTKQYNFNSIKFN